MELDIDLDRDELADRLGGKLPQGSLGLIEGVSGAGKSVTAQRLAYGLLQNGTRVVYVSTEFTTSAFLEQMEGLGYPVQEHFAERQLKFCSTTPMLGHPVPKKDRLPRLLESKQLLTEPVVIVDCFSQLAEPHLEDGD
jgi:flagellar protein FlaH